MSEKNKVKSKRNPEKNRQRKLTEKREEMWDRRRWRHNETHCKHVWMKPANPRLSKLNLTHSKMISKDK